MTTPDTAAVRAWAKDNGLTVADRGRLPADLHAAYLAANGGSAKPGPAKPARAARKKADAADKPAGTTVAVDEPADVAVAAPAEKAAKKSPARKTSARTPAKPSARATGGKPPKPRAKKAPAKATRAAAGPAVEAVPDDDELLAAEVEMADHVMPEADAPAATDSPDSSPEVTRLIALEVQLAALAGRVAALEQAHAAPPPKQSRFRRRG